MTNLITIIQKMYYKKKIYIYIITDVYLQNIVLRYQMINFTFLKLYLLMFSSNNPMPVPRLWKPTKTIEISVSANGRGTVLFLDIF